MLNQTISGYTILRLLGKGGMADVYYAENKLKRPAAIKILHASLSSQPEIKLRFENEAQIMVSLDHPNIRKVYDVAEIADRHAIIMEYLEGHTLSEALTNKQLDSSILPDLFNQALTGLQYAHQMGIVHRDIKPSNLFLTKGGQLKILDFGIAKADEASSQTLTGQTLGTILYMSPEQVQDPKRVDYRTDLYSLGVTFYHLLTGKPPYNTTIDSIYNVQTKIVRDEIDLNSLSFDWKYRLTNCLAKLPKDRRIILDDPITTLIEPTVRKKVVASLHINENAKTGAIWKRILYLLLIVVIIGVSIVGVKKIYMLLDKRRWDRVISSLHENYEWNQGFREDIVRVRNNGKYGFVDKYGKEITEINFVDAGDFSDGMAAVKVEISHFGPGVFGWGYIDKQGKLVIKPIYEDAGEFSEGLAPVSTYDITRGLLYGYIDKSGTTIIEHNFEYACPFSEGMARVAKYGEPQYIGQFSALVPYNYGFIDHTGKIVIPMQYGFASDFKNGVARVQSKDNFKFYSISKLGNCIQDCF